MTPSRNKPTDAEWHKYRAKIRRRYIVDQTPLKTLVGELNDLGLSASKHQLEYKLKQWKFSRNIDQETWKIIDLVVNHRSRNGKQSEVIHCGKRLQQEIVSRAMNRHRYIPTLAQPNPPSIPSSPISSQIAICTPPSLIMEFEWPSTLPWLEFQTEYSNSILDIGQLQQTKHDGAAKFTALVQDLNIVKVFCDGYTKPISRRPKVSELATRIGKWMPESYPYEHLQRSHILLGESSEDAIREYLAFFIFSLSNNLPDFSGEACSDMTILLKKHGLLDLRVDLWKSNNPTICSFMEKLFNETLHHLLMPSITPTSDKYEDEFAAFQWLLYCGYPLDTPLRNAQLHGDELITPLIAAIRLRAVLLMEYLLECGANPNLHYSVGDKNTPLMMAVGKVQKYISDDNQLDLASRMVESLLKYGALDGIDEAIHIAIQKGYMPLVDMMAQYSRHFNRLVIKPGLDVDNISWNLGGGSKYSMDPHSIYEQTALSVAAFKGPAETQTILDLLVIKYPERPIASFVNVDTFVAAAIAGQTESICKLYGALLDNKDPLNVVDDRVIYSPNFKGITPLHAAAATGHIDTCRLLLRLHGCYHSYVSTFLSPLHLTAMKGIQTIVQLFVDCGADVNGVSVDPVKLPRRCLFHKSRYLDAECCYEVRTNLTPLQAAMGWEISHSLSRQASLDCASILIHNSAKLMGGEVATAARCSHLKLLTAALEAGGDPNEFWGGKTSLEHALYRLNCSGDNSVNVVKYLLKKGANLKGGEVALATTGGWDLVEDLICRGGSLMDTGCWGITVLEAAIFSNHSDDDPTIENIFKSQPEFYDAGCLCASIVLDNTAVFRRLMKNRPTSLPPSILETTAISIAATKDDLHYFQMLLALFWGKSCPNEALMPLMDVYDDSWSWRYDGFHTWSDWCYMNAHGHSFPPHFVEKTPWSGVQGNHYIKASPLAMAVSLKEDSRREQVLHELLRAGFRPDRLTWQTISESNNLNLAKLLENNPEFHGTLQRLQCSIPNPLIAAIRKESKDMIEILMKIGANVNEQDFEDFLYFTDDYELLRDEIYWMMDREDGDFGRCPLQEAAKIRNREIIDMLIHSGATFNSTPDSSHQISYYDLIPRAQSPLIYIIVRWDKDIFLQLLAIGADINEHNLDLDDSRSPLQKAVEIGDLDIVNCVLSAGADVNAPPATWGGATALQIAAMKGYLGIAKLLIDEHGADVNAKSAKYNGRTALEGASEHGRLDMLEFLIKNGALNGEGWQDEIARCIKFAKAEGHNIVAGFLERYQKSKCQEM